MGLWVKIRLFYRFHGMRASNSASPQVPVIPATNSPMLVNKGMPSHQGLWLSPSHRPTRFMQPIISCTCRISEMPCCPSSCSCGKPAATHAFIPPSSTSASIPLPFNTSCAFAARTPLWHTNTSAPPLLPLAGVCPPSSSANGRCSAPAICPDRHSPPLRTSTTCTRPAICSCCNIVAFMSICVYCDMHKIHLTFIPVNTKMSV